LPRLIPSHYTHGKSGDRKEVQRSGWKRALPYVALTCIALITFLPSLANPGFFNHDELQKADLVQRVGLLGYLSVYLDLNPGQYFGQPVRPLSFAVQGLQALLFHDLPFLFHSVDVLMHVVVAGLVYRLARMVLAGIDGAAFLIACLFLVSPLTTLAVGWSSALMDRLFVLFTLLALLGAVRQVNEQETWLRHIQIGASACLAVLSKETALVAPALMGLFVLASWPVLKSPRFWRTLAVWATPSLLFLAFRLPALINSFAGSGAGAYRPSLSNALPNTLTYVAYPFLVSLAEAVNRVFLSSAEITLAALLHAALVALLWWTNGWRITVAYIATYLLFLVPVLTLPTPSAHYMYASGVPMAFALGLVIWKTVGARRHLLAAFAVLFAGVMSLHMITIQMTVYSVGSCMRTINDTLAAAYLTLGRPDQLTVKADPGAAIFIVERLQTGRSQIAEMGPVSVTVLQADSPVQSSLWLDRQCRVRVDLNQPKASQESVGAAR